MPSYHILNGDALKEQFPESLAGKIIVARECLVDGPVKAESLEGFFALRAGFISEAYGGHSVKDYYEGTVAEFEKIKNLPEQSIVNLWFEDDLFCQVNFWFTSYLLFNFTKNSNVSLVRPKEHTTNGFGGLTQLTLRQIFEDKTPVIELEKIACLWEYYSSGRLEDLLAAARDLQVAFPFILRAVEAHLARIPTKSSKGRPTEAILEIMEALDTKEFPPVFREFNKRENIYGFGDSQVKRIFDEVIAAGE